MSPTQLQLAISGLNTHSNELNAKPGSLSKADNIVINRESVAEPRRGFDRADDGYSDPSYRANKLFFYQGRILTHYATNTLAYLSGVSGGSWTNFSGTYDAPSATVKIRSAQANENFYFTTANGVYKLDAYNGTPALAGAPRALDVRASIPGVPTAAWLDNGFRVAYRVLWGYKDANNNLIQGAVSQRESVKNTSGGVADVSLSITIPQGVTTNWFYQVYRSASVDNTSDDIEPNDELGLVYEANPTGTDITNGYVTVLDITPDELRGATIYTASSQEGLVNSNERPPLAKDIAVFKNHLFYGNVVSKHRYYLTLLAVGGTNGLAINDTLTVGGVTYTAKAAENVSNREFELVTGGSASQNIRDTALSLAYVINRAAASTVVASYLSGPDDLPGKLLLEEEGLGGSAFAVTSSKATCWSPTLPSSGTAESSTNSTYKNGIMFSKASQPEAVPLGHIFFAGSAAKEILRIIPLRDSLFVLKEDGIYRISGEDVGSFRVDLLDETARLLAPESAVVLNNQIFALTDQGVVTVTESGVQVKSWPIESTLLSLQGVDLDALRNKTFGVSYESERKYLLFVPTVGGDTHPTQAFVFNTFTNAWTRWILTKTCGGVNPVDDKLYLGDGESAFVNKERKTFSFTDHVDYGFETTISGVDGLVLTVSSADQISIGDIVYQSASVYSIVDSVDAIAGTVTVQFSAAFVVGAADVLKAIASAIAWVPFTAGNPAAMKHFREVTTLFKQDFSGTAELVFTSDVSPSQEAETIQGRNLGLWGLFGWGEVAWGGGTNRRPIRVLVPRSKQRCSQITVEFQHATAWAPYQLTGISLVFNAGSERVAR